MDPIVECAARTLEQHPYPALRLGELVTLVTERLDRAVTAPYLRELLERHPGVFRLLDPWRGPWRDQAHVKAERFSADPWVLLATDPASDGAPTPTVTTLRESVRWLGREMDARSWHAVSRWYAMALAEREARAAIRKKAA